MYLFVLFLLCLQNILIALGLPDNVPSSSDPGDVPLSPQAERTAEAGGVEEGTGREEAAAKKKKKKKKKKGGADPAFLHPMSNPTGAVSEGVGSGPRGSKVICRPLRCSSEAKCGGATLQI